MNFTKAKFLGVVLLLVSLVGCDSLTTSFTDGYSENPNSPTDAPANKIFVAAQVGTMTFLESHPARKASMFAQYFSGEDRQYRSIFHYNTTASDNDNGWYIAYVRGLTNLRLARAKYKERKVVPANQVAATKILEAMLMGQVTALYGDVPFTQAIKSDSTVTPKYDSQASVYQHINQLLDEAISTLSNNSSAAISGDVTTLGGDPVKWMKVAYTLKARHLMHMGNYSDALTAAQNGIDATDGSGDMLMPHGSKQGRNQNLYYNFTQVERTGYLQANFSYADTMLAMGNNSKTDESARRAYYYSTSKSGDRVLNTTDGFAAETQAFPLVTYLENQLIVAEVEARQGNNQNAIDALNNTRDYLDNKFDPGTDNYQDLTLLDFQTGGVYANTTILQHVKNWTYLGLIGEIEGYNFVRRIDYDVDGLTPIQGSKFPQRFVYPQTERNTNPNVPDPAPGLFDPTPENK